MFSDFETLLHYRQALADQILQQAELYLRHNVQDCRSKRNEGNRWLFRCGMQQGISCGLSFAQGKYDVPAKVDAPLAQQLFEFKKFVIDTCYLVPHKAVINWELTELEDRLDVEREDVINGLDHGITAVANNLPRLLKVFANKKGPLAEPLSVRFLSK